MRTVVYWCVALLLACAAPALAAPADVPAPEPAVAQQGGPQGAATQATPVPATARTPAERRRSRSYARCNRAAIARSLRGGARRRFLIRCRLGYERGIGQPGQAAPAQPPARRP